VQPSHRLTAVFDDPNLMSSAGLVPALRLADSGGLSKLLAQHLIVSWPNAAAKAGCVIGGMMAGADSIERLDLLRRAAIGKVFTGIRTPSTTYLRAFIHGHVQQLDAVGGRLLDGAGGPSAGVAGRRAECRWDRVRRC